MGPRTTTGQRRPCGSGDRSWEVAEQCLLGGVAICQGSCMMRGHATANAAKAYAAAGHALAGAGRGLVLEL